MLQEDAGIAAPWRSKVRIFDRRTTGLGNVASATFEESMLDRDPNQTLAQYRALVRRLDQNRRAYDPVTFAQLTRILRRRMGVWAMEDISFFDTAIFLVSVC